MKYTILSFLFVLCLSASCHDKPTNKSYCEENPGSCQTILEAKKYFAFNVGSWWVYQEENSGQHDSVYVTDAAISNSDYNFDIRTHSTLEGYNYHYWPIYANGSQTCSTVQPVSGQCIYIKRSKGKSGDFVGESYCFFMYPSVGSYIYTGSDPVFCPNNKIIVEDIHENFYNDFINFGYTIQIKELCSFIEGKQPANYFYTKNVGLVRKELTDSNQIWNLVNYHIEP